MISSFQEKIYIISKRIGDRIGLDLPYFVKNGFWVILRQGIGVISGLALSVTFARLATQEVFGQYQFILSILSIVSILSIPGLNTSLIRSVVRGYDGDYKNVVNTSFFWSLLGVPALLIVGVYYYTYQNHSLGIAFMISSIFFPFFYAPNTWDSFLQGKSRFDVATKYSSIQAVINAIATIAVIFFFRNNLLAIVITYLVSYTFFNGYYYWKSLRYIENEKKEEGSIKYGWFLTKIGTLNLLASNLDKIVVGIFLSPSQLAIYSIGILLPKQLQNISKSLLWVTAPKQIKQKDISKRNYLKIFVISVITLTAIWLVLPFLMRLLFSQRYEESIGLAKISILFFPIYVTSLLYKNKFLFSGDKRNIKIESIVSPLIRISLIFILLPVFGLGGLAFLFGFQYVITIFVLCISDKLKLSTRV